MNCPNNHNSFEEIKIGDAKVDRCKECSGLWFNAGELRRAKDFQDEYIKWFDVDLWQKQDSFKVAASPRLCPVCKIPFYNFEYGDSNVRIDVCKNCHGVWLDKDEFNNLIAFIKQKSAYELLHKFTKSLVEEGKEIFTGPESLKSEIGDFLIVLKLVTFKMVAGHPLLTQMIMNLPLTK